MAHSRVGREFPALTHIPQQALKVWCPGRGWPQPRLEARRRQLDLTSHLRSFVLSRPCDDVVSPKWFPPPGLQFYPWVVICESTKPASGLPAAGGQGTRVDLHTRVHAGQNPPSQPSGGGEKPCMLPSTEQTHTPSPLPPKNPHCIQATSTSRRLQSPSRAASPGLLSDVNALRKLNLFCLRHT